MPQVPEKRKKKLELLKWSTIPDGFSLTPLQLLGFILKTALKDRISDDEIDQICVAYHDTVKEWWSSE